MPGDFSFTDQVHPICQIGLGSVREAEPSSWLDVSCHVHEAELFRGRERFNDRFEPGTASITFANDSGWGDLVGAPIAVAGAKLRPGRPIRVGVRGPWGTSGAMVTHWLWRGWIDQTQPDYHPTEHDVVTVNCIDALGEAGQTVAPIGDLVGVHETADNRIRRALNAVGWFPSKRKIADTDIKVQGTTLGAAAIDLMSVAADTAGGVVYGDLDGDVVFKDIDWMLYDPDTPPDGDIGDDDPGDPPIDDEPPYMDPDPGPVHDPDPPIPHHPPKIDICVSGPPAEGTVIEQGDGWKIYIHDGHIWYQSSGHLWDMGPWEDEDECTTITDPGDGPPTRQDPDDIAPFPGIPEPWPFLVELIGYSDAGIDDGPQTTVTVPGLNPGHNCLLVVLVCALCEGSIGSLTPFPIASGSIMGGADITFEEIALREPAGLQGAESYGAAAEIGRDDPGSFDLVVDWALDHASRTHIVTVWKVTGHKADMFDRMRLGAYNHAGTWDRTVAPFPSPNPPGKGFQQVAFGGIDTDGTEIVPYSRPTDITVAQSLAEETVGPFGADFNTADGDWWTPVFAPPEVMLALVAEWADDFERPGPGVGADWMLGLYTSPATSANETLHLFTIDSGAAVGPDGALPAPRDVASMLRVEGTDTVDQSIEIDVDDFFQSPIDFAVIELHNFADPATGQAWVGQITWADSGEVDAAVFQYDGAGTIGDGGAGGSATITAGVLTARLDSYGSGRQVLSLNGTVVIDYTGVAPTWGGNQQGFHLVWQGAATSPRILRANGNGVGAPIVRKCSWVAGYREDAAAIDVKWDEVNYGDDDIQSCQAEIVLESGEDVGFAWRTLAYHMDAPPDGTPVPAGSHTSTIRPERAGLVVVAVGAFADDEIAAGITVTSSTLTFTTVLTQTTDTLGWAQGALFVATLDGFPVNNDTPPTVTVTWDAELEKIGYVVYEIANADSITAHASAVRGVHTAGSVTGGVTLSLSPAPTAYDVALGFLIGSDLDFNESGSDPGTDFVEELEVIGGQYMWLHAQSRTASTTSTMTWAAMDASTSGEAKDVIVFGIVVKPLEEFAMWSSYDPLTIGGSRDAFGGPIYSAEGSEADGTPIWTFDPSTF